MGKTSRRLKAAAVLTLFVAFAAQAEGLPPLDGHWQCQDTVTNGGTTDYYEFDFHKDGTQTTAWKTSGSRYTGKGSWVLDEQAPALIRLASSGEACNSYGFRCHDFASRINFDFEITSSRTVDLRTNGLLVRCLAADGQIDVENWQPSSLEKVASILDVLGNAMVAAGNKGMQYQQMMNGGGSMGGGDNTDGAMMGVESAYNEQDAAEALASDAAKQRRINFLHWFIAKNDQTLQHWQASLQRQEAQKNPPAAYVLSGNRRNIDRLQATVDKAKRELARLEN